MLMTGCKCKNSLVAARRQDAMSSITNTVSLPLPVASGLDVSMKGYFFSLSFPVSECQARMVRATQDSGRESMGWEVTGIGICCCGLTTHGSAQCSIPVIKLYLCFYIPSLSYEESCMPP